MLIKKNWNYVIYELFCKKQVKKILTPRRFLYLLLILLIGYFCSQINTINKSPSNTEPVPKLQYISKPSYKPYAKLFTYIVKRGDTFSNILLKFNISEDQALNCYHSLKSIGFSTLFPGDSLILTKDKSNIIKTFSLLNRLQYWYHLRRKSNSLLAEKIPIDFTRYLYVSKGTLETSLSEDMFRQGIGDALVFKFADIFAWDINFFIDPRKGDEFEVIFEKKYHDGNFIGYGSILAAKYVNGNNTFYAIAMKNKDGKLNYYDINGKSVQKQFLKAPLRFRRISSGYSYSRKHPILGIYRPHLGIDYAAPRGTPVYSAADGTVIFSGTKKQYGNNVCIRHGASYKTYYGHLNKIQSNIKPGVHVKQGQMIGTVGATGLATGPHLDYRMKVGSRFINPLTISVPSKESVPEEDIERFENIKQNILSTFETRFNRQGCFVLDIIQPKSQKAIVSKTTQLPDTRNGFPTSS